MSFKLKEIVVVGSSNLDLVVSSPRIPLLGETLLGDHFFTVPGGKGANQAVAAAKLGGHVTFVTKLGRDSAGEQLYENFKHCGVQLDCIGRSNDAPTGVAFIIIDNQGNNVIVVAPGANQTLLDTDIQQAESKIAAAGVVVAQLEIPLETVMMTARLARRHNVPFILDPAPARKLPPELFKMVSIIKPNETEAEILTGVKVEDERSAKKAAEKLLESGVQCAIITMSNKGFLLATSEGSEFIAGLKVKAVDSTAAGDAFTGAMAFGLSGSKGLKEAALLANKVAAISVTKKGAQSSLPTMEEVNRFIF
jgi:ribokinase